MTKTLNKRFTFILILTALIFSFLVIRITKLMFFQKELIPSTPGIPEYRERGFIVDRNGEKLALSLETYSVYARPREIENKKEAAQRIASTLDESYSKILKLINKNKPFVWIKRQVDLKYTKRIEELDIKGIYTENEYRRYYPFNNLASHIIGFSGIDNIGLEGIEYQFDKILLPKRVDSKGINYSSFRRGYTVVLTIDRYIQEVVEEELDKAWEQTKAELITAIIMDPNTGEILALANKPDYDLNNFQKYSDDTIRNKAITDSFEPGSTFKVFVASILIDNNLIQDDDLFLCEGSTEIEDITIHDIKAHGWVDFRQVLEKSCNIGMIKSVQRIEKDILYDRLRAFGFGTPTGINLPGEAKGILRNPKKWSKVSKSEIAIGQEVSVTPLQLITAASSIAKGGILMQPRIVKCIQKPDGSVLKDFKPLQIRNVIGETTSEHLLDILTGVISDRGTGYRAKVEGYTIAGKTGTAQIADIENGSYFEDQCYSSFLGFIPVPDPKIVILITIKNPAGEAYGGQTAAPISKNIVERIAHYHNILSSFSEIYIVKDNRDAK